MNDPNHGIAFTLPNGVQIVAQTAGDADPSQTGAGFRSIDIVAIYPNGIVDTLCCADYDEESGKLRVFAFDGKSDDMAFECKDYQFVGGELDAHP